MDNQQEHKKKEREPMKKDRQRERLIWKLLRYPKTTEPEQQAILEVKGRQFRNRMDELVKDGWIHPSPQLTERANNLFARLWIFVETSFDRTAFEQQKTRDDSLRDGHPRIDEYAGSGDEYVEYQSFVADVIRHRLRTRHAEQIALSSIDVVLGSDWDIIVKVQTESPEYVHDFVLKEVRTCPFVLRTCTTWARSVGRLRVDHEAANNESDESATG